MERSPAVRVFLLVLAVVLIVLGASGLGLTINYRPEPVTVLAGLTPSAELTRRGGGVLADIHRVSAIGALVLLGGGAVLVGVRAVRPATRDPRTVDTLAVAAVGAAVLAAWIAMASGDGLPWSQILIRASVAPPGGVRGVWRPAFDPLISFVVVDGELSQADYRGRVLLHLFAAPALLGTAGLVAWHRLRRHS